MPSVNGGPASSKGHNEPSIDARTVEIPVLFQEEIQPMPSIQEVPVDPHPGEKGIPKIEAALTLIEPGPIKAKDSPSDAHIHERPKRTMRWGTRKYSLAVFATIAATALCATGLLSGHDWVWAQSLILGLYGAANVTDKKFGGAG